jgi:hypothetical protein
MRTRYLRRSVGCVQAIAPRRRRVRWWIGNRPPGRPDAVPLSLRPRQQACVDPRVALSQIVWSNTGFRHFCFHRPGRSPSCSQSRTYAWPEVGLLLSLAIQNRGLARSAGAFGVGTLVDALSSGAEVFVGAERLS